MSSVQHAACCKLQHDHASRTRAGFVAEAPGLLGSLCDEDLPEADPRRRRTTAGARLPAPSPPMLSLLMRPASTCLLVALVLQALGPGAAHARPPDLELAAAKAGQGVRAVV